MSPCVRHQVLCYLRSARAYVADAAGAIERPFATEAEERLHVRLLAAWDQLHELVADYEGGSIER